MTEVKDTEGRFIIFIYIGNVVDTDNELMTKVVDTGP